jgi:hypothetical protein
MASRLALIGLSIMASTFALGAQARDLVLLSPVMVKGEPVMRVGPKGEPAAPVFDLAAQTALASSIRREAGRGTLAFMLDLDGRAQQIAKVKTPAPTYLLISEEEGGFARSGFWLATSATTQEWHEDPYVNLDVDSASVDDGSFEEICAHELGHLLLRRLLTKLPTGHSTTPHSSLAITDYPTAFDEGFATHFQGLARRLTQNVELKAQDAGVVYKPFLPYWRDSLDRTMRIRGMRDNLFVQRQLETPFVTAVGSSLFDVTELKNGQQMMSSEGVIATLFYHLMLRPADDAKSLQKRYFDLLASISALNQQRLTASTPLFVRLVEAQVQANPAERAYWLKTFVDLTYGATITVEGARKTRSLALVGQSGNGAAFRTALTSARSQLAQTLATVDRDPRRLGAALGAELWLSVGSDEASRPAVNLNTAEKGALVSVLDFDPGLADRTLVNRAQRGTFASIADFAARLDVSDLQRTRLNDAAKAAQAK